MAMRREDLRVADVDRGFVADRLKSALDEGRLSLSEYDERLGLTYAAKTYGDLDKIIEDLPTVVPPQKGQIAPVEAPGSPPAQGAAAAPAVPAAAPAQGAGRRPVAKWLVAIWQVWFIAVSINVVIWLLVSLSAGDPVYFWPMWVGGPWGAVLAATTFSTLLTGEVPNHHGKRDHREMRRAARDERRARRRGYMA